MVSCHLDNIAATRQGLQNEIACRMEWLAQCNGGCQQAGSAGRNRPLAPQ